MTDKMMNLRELAEKTADADMLREMIAFAAQRLMDLEIGGRTGVAYGEKSGERLVQRNSLIDLSFDVELTGFETAEIDLLLDEVAMRVVALPNRRMRCRSRSKAVSSRARETYGPSARTG